MARKGKKKKIFLAVLIFCCVLLVFTVLAAIFINAAVLRASDGKISVTLPTGTYDAILVLGAGVRDDGSPSDMLSDRIDVGVAAYQAGLAPVLLMSGDSQNAKEYDEVGTMKRVATEAGVPEEAILTDGMGLSTAESVRRALGMFGFDRILIVSQSYHLPRALFIASSLGIDADGADAAIRIYRGQEYRDLREVAARIKDYLVITISHQKEG